MPSGFHRPLWRGWALREYVKEWVVTGVREGQGRREGANDGGKQE